MTEPTRRGRPPKVMAQPVDRLTSLTAREKALAIKARARHRYTLDLPLELYEAMIEQAESWDQPLPDVVRACIRAGLNHIRQFGNGANPFAYGKLNGPKESDLDPRGYDIPRSTQGVHVEATPNWNDIPFEGFAPATTSVSSPTRFVRPTPLPGLMPNGATPMVTDNPDVPRTPTIPEDTDA